MATHGPSKAQYARGKSLDPHYVDVVFLKPTIFEKERALSEMIQRG